MSHPYRSLSIATLARPLTCGVVRDIHFLAYCSQIDMLFFLQVQESQVPFFSLPALILCSVVRRVMLDVPAYSSGNSTGRAHPDLFPLVEILHRKRKIGCFSLPINLVVYTLV